MFARTSLAILVVRTFGIRFGLNIVEMIFNISMYKCGLQVVVGCTLTVIISMFVKGEMCVTYPKANKYAPMPENVTNATQPCANYTGLSGDSFMDNLYCKLQYLLLLYFDVVVHCVLYTKYIFVCENFFQTATLRLTT